MSKKKEVEDSAVYWETTGHNLKRNSKGKPVKIPFVADYHCAFTGNREFTGFKLLRQHDGKGWRLTFGESRNVRTIAQNLKGLKEATRIVGQELDDQRTKDRLLSTLNDLSDELELIVGEEKWSSEGLYARIRAFSVEVNLWAATLEQDLEYA